MIPSLVVRLKDFIKFKLIACYKLIVPSFVKKHWIEEHEKQIDVFYSQQGEDIILHRMFEWQEQGFYIDVGAHHPTRFSNTYKFYKRGWTGINVDAMPGSMTAFNRLRPKDINIEAAVSDVKQDLIYYEFDDRAINTFSKDIAEKIIANKMYHLVKKHNIETTTLESIIQNNLPKNVEIDFLSVDVEGFDFNVLKSNNWELYKPKCIAIETLESEIEDVLKGEVNAYLNALGYTFFAKTKYTCFFRLDK